MATFIVTEKKVYWSKFFEDQAKIITEHNLFNRTVVVVRAKPENERFYLPLDKWTLEVLNGDTPPWWDSESEQRVWDELPKWIESKIVLPGEAVEEIYCGRHFLRVYGTVNEVHQDGVVYDVYRNGCVHDVFYGGTVGTVRNYGTVRNLDHGGTARRIMDDGIVNDLTGEQWAKKGMKNGKIGTAGP